MKTLDVRPERSTQPRYWIGFLLNFVGFGGFAYINRLWPTVLFSIAGHLVSGPFARLLWGRTADRYGSWLLLILMVVAFISYNRTYRAAYSVDTASTLNLPMLLRMLGLWLAAIMYLVMKAGYAQGWLPLPSGT